MVYIKVNCFYYTVLPRLTLKVFVMENVLCSPPKNQAEKCLLRDSKHGPCSLQAVPFDISSKLYSSLSDSFIRVIKKKKKKNKTANHSHASFVTFVELPTFDE